MTRMFLALVLVTGCYADLRLGGSAPVGAGHGGAGIDLGIGLGFEHRGDRIRAGGGLNTGVHGSDEPNANSYVPLGAEGRIDVGLTEPNERGGRLIGVGQLALGYARSVSDDPMMDTPGGVLAQAFLGLGLGATRLTYPGSIAAGSVSIGLLLTRFSPDPGDGYWMVGAGLSVSGGLDIAKVLDR